MQVLEEVASLLHETQVPQWQQEDQEKQSFCDERDLKVVVLPVHGDEHQEFQYRSFNGEARAKLINALVELNCIRRNADRAVEHEHSQVDTLPTCAIVS